MSVTSQSVRRPGAIEGLALIAVVLIALAWSAWKPFDWFTWGLEVSWVILGLPLILTIWTVFPLTRLLCWLLTIHAVILIIGAHYTYAHVPLGTLAGQFFGWERNHYDRLGHFAQGFIPAILAREILLRRSPLKRGRWLAFIVVSICLAFSALFELLEWAAAIGFGDWSAAFLGSQGDDWDAQADMMWAGIGACVSLAMLSRVHDRQLIISGNNGREV